MPACNSEMLQKQAEQIKQQELEIAQQRKDLEAMLASQKQQDQRQQDCNRAFRDYFEKAQIASDADQAIALYRAQVAGDADPDLRQFAQESLHKLEHHLDMLEGATDLVGAEFSNSPIGRARHAGSISLVE